MTRGADTGKSFELPPDQALIVGRGTNSQTRLRDPEISRVHFSVEYNNGRILVTDLGSSTGTYVNGLRIRETTEIDTGDEINVGGSKIFVSLVGRIESDTMEPSRNSILYELNSLIGSWMGPYFLKRILGVGKTGLVFEAFDEARGRAAAVKVFSQRYTSDNERRKSFVQGAKAFCKIQHPHLIRLFQAGRNSDSYFYSAMELVEGESLDSLISRTGIEGMLDWKEVWKCAYQISYALQTTFENNVLHRNLIPRNIIRRFKDENYMLGDFALATPIDPGLKNWRGKEYISDLYYLPPERLQNTREQFGDDIEKLNFGGTMDIRSDIFGLGATCYAMLTGKPPADGADVLDIITSIRRETPPLPTQSHMSVNDQFQSVVMRMIAKNPNDRFQNPQQLLKELSRIAKLNALKF